MREITLNLSQEDFNIEHITQMQQTIGRLATWNMGNSYDRVQIQRDCQPTPGVPIDMVAVYTASNGHSGPYVIGAVWRPEMQKYSFHS